MGEQIPRSEIQSVLKKPTDWDKKIEKRTANIGFISKVNGFRDPTPAEKYAALAHEINSWQESIGKSEWKISAPYSIAKGPGINLKADRECGEPIKGLRRERAIAAFLNTPMDKGGVLKALDIDVTPYENPPNKIQKLYKARKSKISDHALDILLTFITGAAGFIMWLLTKGKL